MIGEPDAGKLQVRFDEGMQETCGYATRLRPTLRAAVRLSKKFWHLAEWGLMAKKGLIKTIRKKRKAPRGCCREGL
jgi:hypothetical protein